MLKNILFILVLFAVITPDLFAAGGGGAGPEIPCSSALPFCTANTYSFPNETNTSSPSGLNYGCLSSQPNPVWYYMEVDQAGTFQIKMTQSTSQGGPATLDIDFALWGPFTNVSNGCAAINGGQNPIQCSYSTAATETVGIGMPGGTGSGSSTPPAANVGDVYILLLTNYDQGPGYIRFSQTGGTGVADCSIIEPNCNIRTISATPSACTTNNKYSVSGQVSFDDPPSTGTLTISASCGGNQVFNAPFTSPISYTINGLNADGNTCTITASFSDTTCVGTFDFTAPSIPVINGGADQTVCQGVQVTLNATGANTYAWTGGVSNGVPFNAASTQTYTVTGTSTNGCSSTDQVTITVKPSTTYTISYTSPACINGSDPQPVISQPITGNYSISPTTVSIDPATGIIDVSSAVVTNSQNYIVTYTPTDSCNATVTTSIIIAENPVVDGGQDQTICRNDQVTLSATGANSYQWTGGAVNNTPFAPTATTQYIVTGFNQYGCTDKDTVLITVNQLPPVVAINDVAICRGDSTVLLATGAPSYTWTGGIQNGDYVSPSQTTTYYVTGTAANGCKKTDSVLVFVHQLPMIDAGPETTVCLNFPYIPKGAYGVQYEWSHNATNEQPVFLPLGNNWMYVIGTDANGCSNTDSVLVHVIKPPVTHFTPDKYVGYPGTVFTFTNNSENANSYYWDFANGSNTTTHSVTQDVTSQYSAEGDYIVVLTADNGVCKYPYQDTVHIIPFPDPTIFVPNVFTPNNDGANDRFFLTVEWGKQIEVIILNRWGNHMATITDFNQGWDGRTMNGQEATEGVYFYKYEILGFNNKTYTGQGFVTLER